MAMLRPTKTTGRVVSLLLNSDDSDLTSDPIASVSVDYGGFVGDVHSGLTRPSCVRVRRQYPEGTEIRNTRQISALSAEDLAQIASTMEIDHIEPAWVGANLIIEGIPRFSKLPPSSRLIFDNGTSLVVDMENAPCKYPGDIIERHHAGKGKRFAQAAIDRRGVTLWVERAGEIAVGDTATLHVPPPVTWQSG